MVNFTLLKQEKTAFSERADVLRLDVRFVGRLLAIDLWIGNEKFGVPVKGHLVHVWLKFIQTRVAGPF